MSSVAPPVLLHPNTIVLIPQKPWNMGFSTAKKKPRASISYNKNSHSKTHKENRVLEKNRGTTTFNMLLTPNQKSWIFR